MLSKFLVLALAVTAAKCATVNVNVAVGAASVFQSPNYPNDYGTNEDMTYIISGPAGSTKGLQFTAAFFELEYGAYDTLTFTETVNGNVVNLGRFSGNHGPNKLRSAGNQVTARFRSDSSIVYSGFSIQASVPACELGANLCRDSTTVCIRPNQYCDGTDDCPGGTDETCGDGCGNPAFPPSINRFKALFAKKAGRIVGGTEVVPHTWPWQVAMLSSSGSQLCGGSVLSNEWIMTAAHCCEAYTPVPSSYKVRVGAHDLDLNEESARTYTLSRVVVHPDYENPQQFANDFCLMKTSEPMQLGPEVSTVCLPTLEDGPPGKQCWVTGWGSSRPARAAGSFADFIKLVKAEEQGLLPKGTTVRVGDTLRQVDQLIVSQEVCSAAYPGMITPDMVCGMAPGKDSCQGDSGGPFVCQDDAGAFKLVGVVSWGRGCARPDIPGVYARTATALDWITQTMFST